MATVAEVAAAQAEYWCSAGPGKRGGPYSVGYSQPDREQVFERSDERGYLTADANADCGTITMGAIMYGLHVVEGVPWGSSRMFRLSEWWTGNLRQGLEARGYHEVPWADSDLYPDGGLKVGDVLLSSTAEGGVGHVATVTAGGVSEAWIAEDGSIDGYTGDQSGGETRTVPYESHPHTTGGRWTGCFRYTGGNPGWYLEPDGVWAEKTGARFREVMGAPKSAPWKEVCKSFQRFLNWGLDAYGHQRAHGGFWVNEQGDDDRATWSAFQQWWNDSHVPAGHRIAVDGVYGPETVKAIQHALNHSWAGSKALALKP